MTHPPLYDHPRHETAEGRAALAVIHDAASRAATALVERDAAVVVALDGGVPIAVVARYCAMTTQGVNKIRDRVVERNAGGGPRYRAPWVQPELEAAS